MFNFPISSGDWNVEGIIATVGCTVQHQVVLVLMVFDQLSLFLLIISIVDSLPILLSY